MHVEMLVSHTIVTMNEGHSQRNWYQTYTVLHHTIFFFFFFFFKAIGKYPNASQWKKKSLNEIPLIEFSSLNTDQMW